MHVGRTLISEEKIHERICEMAAQINKDYEGESVIAVFILKGGVYFAAELSQQLKVPCRIDFFQTSSYGDGTESNRNVIIKKDTDADLKGENVIIMEDIVDTGYSMTSVLEKIREKGPKSVKVAALLSKPSRREVEVNIDYLGFEIENEFVVGFGLDYANHYRNLPYIAIMEE